MAAYAELQSEEFAAETRGYTATKHQREVSIWPQKSLHYLVEPHLQQKKPPTLINFLCLQQM